VTAPKRAFVGVNGLTDEHLLWEQLGACRLCGKDRGSPECCGAKETAGQFVVRICNSCGDFMDPRTWDPCAACAGENAALVAEAAAAPVIVTKPWWSA
jgi:hypothetical protein